MNCSIRGLCSSCFFWRTELVSKCWENVFQILIIISRYSLIPWPVWPPLFSSSLPFPFYCTPSRRFWEDEKRRSPHRHPRLRLEHRCDAESASAWRHRRHSTAATAFAAAAAATAAAAHGTDNHHDDDSPIDSDHNDDDNQSNSSPYSISHAKRTYRVIAFREREISSIFISSGKGD